MTTRRKHMIISGICALIAVLAVFAYTASIRSEAQVQRAAALQHYGGERVQVVVTRSDIALGATVSADNVSTADWLVDLLPQGEVATSIDQVKGLMAQVAIKRNEPLLLERVGSGVSRIAVPDGLEAVSISSYDVLAVGGAIQAGSFVDIYVETSKGTIAALGSKILVLETSGSTKGIENAEKLTWVTLAVTPGSVSDLIAASTKGTIHLALPGASSGQGVDG